MSIRRLRYLVKMKTRNKMDYDWIGVLSRKIEVETYVVEMSICVLIAGSCFLFSLILKIVRDILHY